jgi:hypothetical protein
MALRHSLYLIRPLTSDGGQILTEDIQLIASSIFTAKEKAQLIFPGAAEYKILDVVTPKNGLIQRPIWR